MSTSSNSSNPDRTIFEKIIAREIPAEILHEDDDCIAFKDVSPQAPTHFLVVPKRVIVSVKESSDDDAAVMGHLLCVARRVAEQEGLKDGFRVVANSGPDGGQSVDHLHLHVLGGRKLTWPPG